MNKATNSKLFAILAVSCYLSLASAQQQSLVPQTLPASGQIGAQQAPMMAPAIIGLTDPTANCSTVTTKPSPAVAKYSVGPTNCTLLQFAGYLTVGQGQYIELKNGQVNHNTSTCPTNGSSSVVIIDYPCAQLAFNIATNNSQVYVAAINGFYQVTTNNGTLKTPFYNATSLFAASQENHYKCNAAQSVSLKLVEAPTTSVTMEVSNFALESYRNTNSSDFYKAAQDCDLDSQPVSDLVRIGVGVCLVALVAIVLVAYFVGRRRWSGRSSYESV